MALRVSSRFPTTIDIDGEPIRLSIARLTQEEWAEFEAKFVGYGRDGARGERAADRKRRDLLDAVTPEELAERRRQMVKERERAAVADPPIPFEEPTDAEVRATFEPTPFAIAAALEAEMDREALKRQRDAELADVKEGDAFTLESISKYVRVEPKQLYDDDNEVVTGEQFVQAFSSRRPLLTSVMALIWTENKLSDAVKKKLRLQRGSSSGSTPVVTGTGSTPASTATSAEASDTAAPAAVTV